MAKLITIKTFLHRHEAEIAHGLLDENGIEAVISADDAGGAVPMASLGMGNIRLQVQESDAAKAKETLQVLETNVDGALWEENGDLTNLPETGPGAEKIKKENQPKVGILIFLLIFIFGLAMIFFLKYR